MRNAKKTLSLMMVAIFTTFIVLSGVPASAATTAQAKAQVTKATAAVVKVEKTVKVTTFVPATAQAQLTVATKEVAKVNKLGKTYKTTYLKLVARYQAVSKKITARKLVIANLAKTKLFTDADKAVTAAEKATNPDEVDLVADAAALATAQGTITNALELIVKLDKNSANYKGLMARVDAANGLIVKAMEDITAAEEAAKLAAEAKAKLEAAIAAAETAVKAVEAAPLATAADLAAALELGKTAATAVTAVTDTDAAAAFAARLKVVADKGLALQAKLAADAEALKPATVLSVVAADGVITVNFDKKPLTTAAAVDFTVTRTITTAGAVTTTVVIGNFNVVSDTAVTFTVPTVAAITTEQSVVYSVQYTTGTAVSTKAVTVAKLPVIEVASITALNPKQVQVVFNVAVDATTAETATNYTVGGVVFGTAALQADNKTVVLTLAAQTAMTNAATVEVKVLKAVKDAAGVAMTADYAKTISVSDAKVPEFVSVVAVGGKTLKLTFDEPVYDAGADAILENDQITVKSGIYTYSVTKAEADYAKKTITLTLGTALIAGEVTIAINAPGMADGQAIRDFAGLIMLPKTVAYTYAVDTAVATATLESVNKATKVATVTFSKPVYGTNVRLYHTINGEAAYGTPVVTKNEAAATDTWEFTFTNAVPSGNLNFYLANSATASEQLTDLYGVKVPSQAFIFNVVADTAAPTVSTVTVNSNTSIDIAFNEALDATQLTTVANYSIKDSTGAAKSFTVSTVDTKTARLSLALEDNATYTVTVNAMKDVAGNAMTASYTVNKQVADNTNPTITDKYIVGTKDLYVVFSENMNVTDITNKANFTVDGAALSADDTITKISDKKIKITIALGTLVGGTSDFVIGAVRDAGGKKLVNDTVFSTAVNNVTSADLTVASVKMIATNKIKLTFSKALSSFDASEFSIRQTDNGATDVTYAFLAVESNAINADGVSEVVLVLDHSLRADAKDNSVTPETVEVLVKAAPANTKSTESVVLTANGESTIADGVAPTIKTVKYMNASTIEVTFTEVLDAASLAAAGKNGFSVNGGTLLTALTGATNDKVILTGDDDFTANTDVTYTAGNITDNSTAKNALASVTFADALTVATITVVPAATPDNNFTITTNYDNSVITAGMVDMDSVTAGVQNTIAINGITYTVTAAAGTVTITATGTSTAISAATSASFVATVDGVAKTITMAIPAYAAAAAAAVQPVIAAQ